MSMKLSLKFEVWYGGKFELNKKTSYPKIIYIGGSKHVFENMNFDRFNFNDLYGLYDLCGGNKVNVNFLFLFLEFLIW